MPDDDEITVYPPHEETMNTIYSENVLRKAGDLVLAAMTFPGEYIREDETVPNVWWVQGSGLQEYRVARIGVSEDGEEQEGFEGIPWMTCSCPNGSARGGRPTCYHSASVLLMLEEEEHLHDTLEDDQIN